MSNDAEQDYYEEDLKRHNDMCEYIRKNKLAVGADPGPPPELNEDGSYKVEEDDIEEEEEDIDIDEGDEESEDIIIEDDEDEG